MTFAKSADRSVAGAFEIQRQTHLDAMTALLQDSHVQLKIRRLVTLEY